MLKVQNLHKEFPGCVAVNNLSFEIGEGVICGFIGPNGAGKTTTMRMVATLESPTFGEAWIDGHSILTEPYSVRRRIGFMPDHLVTDYLEFYARAYDVDTSVRRSRLDDIIDFTELYQVADKKVETLSKGWRQRLNMGRALVNDPALLVMDEPAAGLDPRARIELRLLIKALAERGKSIFISSHILTELGEICDDLLIIERGSLLTQGNVDQLRKNLAAGHAITIRPLNPDDAERVEKFVLPRPHVNGITWRPQGSFLVEFTGSEEDVADLLDALIGEGIRLTEFRLETSSMEDMFLQLTEGGIE
jgi:ABC-2 type transport system ATP-binding protein